MCFPGSWILTVIIPARTTLAASINPEPIISTTTVIAAASRIFAPLLMASSPGSAGLGAVVDPDAYGLARAVDGHQLAVALAGQGAHGGGHVELIARRREEGIDHGGRDLHLDLLAPAALVFVRADDQIAA